MVATTAYRAEQDRCSCSPLPPMSTPYDCCPHIACAEFKHRQGSKGVFFIRWESSRAATTEEAVAQFHDELIGYNYRFKYLFPPQGREQVHEVLLRVTTATEGRPLPPLRYPAQGFVFGEGEHGWRSVSCLQSLQWDTEIWIEMVERRPMDGNDESLLSDLRSIALEKQRARHTACSCRAATKI